MSRSEQVELTIYEVSTADRTHVPELEATAINQRPKSRDHREPRLYRYDGTELYQWFSRVGMGSFFYEPFGEPFVIRAPSALPVEGWKLVPCEADDAMKMAGAAAPRSDATRGATNTLDRHLETTADIYRAMLSASPPEPGVK